MLYYIIASLVFFATLAMMVREGLWNNLINISAILIGGLTAFGVYQPITIYIDEKTGGSYTYLLDLVVIWIVFAVVVGFVQLFAQMLSRTRVLFPEKIDMPAGAAVAALAGFLMCSFAMAALHTAPLSRDSFGGGFIYGDTRKEVAKTISETSGLSKPDLAWLKMTEALMTPARFGGAGFSASVYVHENAEHRRNFESIKETIVKRR